MSNFGNDFVKKEFEGISAAEGGIKDGAFQITLVKDHPVRGGSSTFYRVDRSLFVDTVVPPFNLKNIEALRYARAIKAYVYAFEENKKSGVFVVDSTGVQKILMTLDTNTDTGMSDNRGIEGLAIDDKRDLWVASESGRRTDCHNDSIAFYRFSIDSNGLNYNSNTRKVYKYPFNRCTCSGGQFDSQAGNGVSEIIALPGQQARLLVLERCFNKIEKKIQAKLWLATPTEHGIMQKSQREVLDFGSIVLPQGHKLDNLEAMAWGEEVDGEKKLYIFSDDNNGNTRQKNQYFILKVSGY